MFSQEFFISMWSAFVILVMLLKLHCSLVSCPSKKVHEITWLLLLIILARFPVPKLDDETGLVRIDIDGITQSLDLLTCPCSFTFSSINRDILIFEPDNQEKSACGKSKLNVVVDLFNGSLIEIEKESFSLDDGTLFTQIQPIINNACEQIRSLLDL